MKRNLFFSIIFSLAFSSITNAQVLNVPLVVQEQNQWCWAGVSNCILDYYGLPYTQCEIAEYARTAVTWTSYGTTDCCVDPSQGCNYWNYNYGNAGSIQDILIHFGNIPNAGLNYAINQAEIVTESGANRPFVIRWGWFSGGGHFVVGHGITANDLSYMNPWPGEGLHIADYSWVENDGTHLWTHTNKLLTAPTAIGENIASADVSLYPNPADDYFTVTIQTENQIDNADFILADVTGREVMNIKVNGQQAIINIAELASGIYFYRIESAGAMIGKGKVVVE